MGLGSTTEPRLHLQEYVSRTHSNPIYRAIRHKIVPDPGLLVDSPLLFNWHASCTMGVRTMRALTDREVSLLYQEPFTPMDGALGR